MLPRRLARSFRALFVPATTTLSVASLLACGGSPAAVSVAPPAPSAAPKAAGPAGPVEVINLAAEVVLHEGYDPSLLFSKGGMLAFRGPAGFHRVDPTTGIERVLWRSAGTAGYVRYSSERFVLLEATGPFRSILIDLDAATARELPGGTGFYAFSKDEAQLLWQPSEGPATLFDTGDLRAVRTFPAPASRGHAEPALSSDGRYAYVHGAVYAVDGERVLWSAPAEAGRVTFTTVSEHPVLFVSQGKTLDVVELPEGKTHRANADCIDASSSRSEWFGGPLHPWFVRTCPRGLLAVDLAALLRSSAPLLQPARIRNGAEYRITPEGALAIRVDPAGNGPPHWVLHEAMGEPPKKLSAPPASPNAGTGRTVVSSSTDGTHRVIQDANGCRLMIGNERHDLGPTCPRTAVSPDGRFVAAASDYGLTIRRLPALTPVFQTDPQGLERGSALIEGSFYDEDEIVVSRSEPLDPKATLAPFSIARTEGVPIGGAGVATQDAGAAPSDLTGATEPGEGSEVNEAGELVMDYEARRPHRGEIEGFVVRDESPRSYGALALWSFTATNETDARLMLTLGPDFGIFESPKHRFQLVGNRVHAATWLRCLEPDGVLRPFETCAARVSAVLF